MYDIFGCLIILNDSLAGVVYRLDVNTGNYVTVLDDPTMKPTAAIVVGIRGIQIRNGDSFIVNTAQGNYVHIFVHPDETAAGAAVVLITNLNSKGFAFDHRSDAYAAQETPNGLAFIRTRDGNPIILTWVALNAAYELAGPSACNFGRIACDFGTFYISITGGLASGQASNLTLGATMSKVDIGSSGHINKAF